MRRVYAWLLVRFDAAERRCSWCGALMGWIRGTRGKVSHGMCAGCASNFGEGAA